ncbi:thioredoxin [Natronorubrum thiooxidans]|uniref:Thioredoxin n=1 Tax=Natronorubrum thiooxidans TaxID=308853 RepID=A0A1N7DLI9_9EURY|nr:thioredoxin [Natronorubrum thiooxidans]SIR76749.1 thioredoxin [Natronorubrum thiooxidans]
MSDAADDERQRIREQKKQELRDRLENGGSLDDAQQTASPSEPISVRGGDHLESVVNDHDVVLVDCYADWCGPCQMLEPTVKALAAETDAAVAKVDIDANQGLAQQLGARSVPTLLIYADGQPVERMVGVQDKATLKGLIEQHS